MTFISILTSVIGAVYYLSIVKQISFFKSDYIYNNHLVPFNIIKLTISSPLCLIISLLTLLLSVFIFIPNESSSATNILCLKL